MEKHSCMYRDFFRYGTVVDEGGFPDELYVSVRCHWRRRRSMKGKTQIFESGEAGFLKAVRAAAGPRGRDLELSKRQRGAESGLFREAEFESRNIKANKRTIIFPFCSSRGEGISFKCSCPAKNGPVQAHVGSCLRISDLSFYLNGGVPPLPLPEGPLPQSC